MLHVRRKYLSVAEAVKQYILSTGLRYGCDVTQLTSTSWDLIYLSLPLCKFNPIKMDIYTQYESLFRLIILLSFSILQLPTNFTNLSFQRLYRLTDLHLYAPRALCIVSPVGIANAEPSRSIQRLAQRHSGTAHI